jgi:predicted short-subunit dehydrogenase-like oxidoreductase (DUF2520 family)
LIVFIFRTKYNAVKIVIIGSGNVATVLGRKMLLASHEIVQVFSRQELHAKNLAAEFLCAYASSWDKLDQEAELYLAAISDQALLEMGQQLCVHKKLVLHTAGAVSKEVLKPVSRNYGVIYPLQSLSRVIALPREIPLLVDGNTAEDLTLIFDFAKTISDQVRVADDETRLKLHTAAIFVNNFSNHLYALAEKFCLAEKLDFQWLLPLIRETANRLAEASPKSLQTGPAIRNDQETIRKHLSLLKPYPGLYEVYELLTQSIGKMDRYLEGDLPEYRHIL